jgi:hypothetical protein
MGARGRMSAAEAAMIGLGGIETIHPPEPPEELTPEQAHEWRAVVNRLRPDWFPRETQALLVQYCRLICRARFLARLIEALEARERFDVKMYRDLLRSEQAVTLCIASLSTKMRLNQTSTMRQDRLESGKPSMRRLPWERNIKPQERED